MTTEQMEEMAAIQEAYVAMQEEQASADRKLDKNGRKIPARRIYDKDSKDYEKTDESVEALDELSRKTLGSYVKKATNQVAKSAYGAGVYKGVDQLPIQRVKGAEEMSTVKKRGAGIAKAVDKLTKEDVESLDELSTATLDSYRKKAFDTQGFTKGDGRRRATDKLNSHGDSKVQSSEHIASAKSEIKGLIKPEHHAKYPISKITNYKAANKIYKDASAAGHLKEEVDVEVDESVRSDKVNKVGSMLDRMYAKAAANTKKVEPTKKIKEDVEFAEHTAVKTFKEFTLEMQETQDD